MSSLEFVDETPASPSPFLDSSFWSIEFLVEDAVFSELEPAATHELDVPAPESYQNISKYIIKKYHSIHFFYSKCT